MGDGWTVGGTVTAATTVGRGDGLSVGVGCGDGDGATDGGVVGCGETRTTCSVSLNVLNVVGVGCGVAFGFFCDNSRLVGVATLAITRGRSGGGGVGTGVAGGGVTTGRETWCAVTGTGGAGIGGTGTGLAGCGVRISVWMMME